MAKAEEKRLQINMMLKGENLINPELQNFERMETAPLGSSTSNARKRKRKSMYKMAAAAVEENAKRQATGKQLVLEDIE